MAGRKYFNFDKSFYMEMIGKQNGRTEKSLGKLLKKFRVRVQNLRAVG